MTAQDGASKGDEIVRMFAEFQEGMTFLQAGKLDLADKLFWHIVTQFPDHDAAMEALGKIALLRGDYEAAEELTRRALACGEVSADRFGQLGQALAAQRQWEEAAHFFARQVDLLTPGFAESLGNLGEALASLQRHGDAQIPLQRSVALTPNNVRLVYLLGHTLYAQGYFQAAAKQYQRVTELKPDFAQAWNDWGSAEAQLNEQANAVTCFRRALELEPGRVDFVQNLGQALFSLGEVEESLVQFRRADRLSGTIPAVTMQAVVIPGSQLATNASIRDARRIFASHCLPPVSQDRPVLRRPLEAPLRVGYISAFFPDRNWMKPVWSLINAHDRQRFRVHLFSDAPRGKIRSGYQPQPYDRFFDTTNLSNEALADLIRKQGIDLLVDLNGYSCIGRLGLFSLRPAPIVIGWFNHFATAGIEGFDYLVGDAEVVPAEEEVFYVEKIARVEGSYLTFTVDYPVPEVTSLPAEKNGWITFGALASQYKITPAMTQLWSEILLDCPGSRLILRNATMKSLANQEYLRARFLRHGVPAAAIDIRGPVEHYEFLQTYGEIDIALDTFPYNGGTTTTEALWQGVPVVAMRGDRWVARTSASILTAGNHANLIARDREDYVRLACRLADPGNRAALAAMRAGMRDHLRASPVCAAGEFARRMENLYLSFAAGNGQ